MSMIAFYTGGSGMVAFQNKLNVVAHNLANVQTNGYKTRRAVFQDLLYNRINTNVEGNHLQGHGVKQELIDQIMLQAGLDQTMNPTDFAIVGDGFFQVDNRGEIEYTRNGAFTLSVEGNDVYLVTNDGAYVLDRAGNRIALSRDADGSFTTDDLLDRLGVYTFPNQWGLDPRNNARYVVSANSGEAVLTLPNQPNAANPLEVLQGTLEFSGVNMADEMVNMIQAQRAFQVNSRVVTTADQMAEEINNLR